MISLEEVEEDADDPIVSSPIPASLRKKGGNTEILRETEEDDDYNEDED